MAATADRIAPPRRGVPGLLALPLGLAALALLPVARGAAVVLGAVASLTAGLELAEVHRTHLRMAIAGLLCGVAAIGGAFVLGARETLDLSTLVDLYFNLDVVRNVLPSLWRGAWNTLRYAVVGEIGGVTIGMLVALTYISRNRLVRAPAVAYVDVFRGTPLLLQISFIGFGLPFVGIRLDLFTAGALALALNSAAYVAEIFRAGIQSIERGQMEAARGLGMPHRAAMRYVVIPQAVRRVIPPLMNEFIALLKDSSLVVILGVAVADRELLRVARDASATTGNPTPFVAAGLIYLMMTVPLTRVVNRLERGVRAPA